MLRRSKARYAYIDIRRDAQARDRVREINNGYESVPTLVFPDGSTLTEPPAGQLRRKLGAMGYPVPAWTVLVAYWNWILIGGVVVFAALRLFGVL